MSARSRLGSGLGTYHCLGTEEGILIRDKIDNDTERQPDVREREPGEDQREDVVLVHDE